MEENINRNIFVRPLTTVDSTKIGVGVHIVAYGSLIIAMAIFPWIAVAIGMAIAFGFAIALAVIPVVIMLVPYIFIDLGRKKFSNDPQHKKLFKLSTFFVYVDRVVLGLIVIAPVIFWISAGIYSLVSR